MMDDQGQGDVWRGVKVAVFVSVVGPILGGLILVMLALCRLLVEQASLGAQGITISDFLGVAGFVGVFSFVLGGLPALLSGAMLGWLTVRQRNFGIGRLVAMVGVALVMSGVIFEVLVFNNEQRGSAVGLMIFLLPFSLISAVMCRYLMLRLGLLYPN